MVSDSEHFCEELKIMKDLTLEDSAYYPYSRVSLDEDSFKDLEESYKSKWHGAGPICRSFEEKLAKLHGTDDCVVVNSGSMANLIGLESLSLPRGSTIMVCAAGFPATVYPVLRLGMVPYFVDADLDTFNISLGQVEKHIDNVDAVFISHLMGIPLEMSELKKITRDKLIFEDCCESIDTSYKDKKVGSYGEFGTLSFYPSHQLNAFGGGGAILTSNKSLASKARSLRSWGQPTRHPGYHKTDLDQTVGGVKYDRHYTFVEMGYNAFWPDPNCAYGLRQLDLLEASKKRRQENWEILRNEMRNYPVKLIKEPLGSDCNYFAFPLMVEDNDTRDTLVRNLEENGIETRLFLGGNLTKQPVFKDYERDFYVADTLMKTTLIIGCNPTLKDIHFNRLRRVFSKVFK